MKRQRAEVDAEEDEGDMEAEDWGSNSSLISSPNAKKSSLITRSNRSNKNLIKVKGPLEATNASSTAVEGHARTIVHIDLDCFYAQVEMIRNPSLRDKPLGIQQKYIVVTCNYVARKYGVTKLMNIKDALQKCPSLVLVSGEDLTNYREMSQKVTGLLQEKFCPVVERLGFDENFIDVSSLVEQKLMLGSEDVIKENVFQSESPIKCSCGCHKRIAVGSQIAYDMRQALKEELQITSCAGVAHNKLLAKIVGEQHKPNDQTLIFPEDGPQLMLSQGKVRKIPGIGHTSNKRLQSMGISTVRDLQEASVRDLQAEFGSQVASTMIRSSYGVDDSPVIKTGPPQSISDEDSFRKLSSVTEAREAMMGLLDNLLKRLHLDGRTPHTIRLTVRKFSLTHKWHRESKQMIIPHHILNSLTKGNFGVAIQVLDILLQLFHKLVDTTKPFHLTLINICFANFQTKENVTLQSFFSVTKKESRKGEILPHAAGSQKDSQNVEASSQNGSATDLRTIAGLPDDYRDLESQTTLNEGRLGLKEQNEVLGLKNQLKPSRKPFTSMDSTVPFGKEEQKSCQDSNDCIFSEAHLHSGNKNSARQYSKSSNLHPALDDQKKSFFTRKLCERSSSLNFKTIETGILENGSSEKGPKITCNHHPPLHKQETVTPNFESFDCLEDNDKHCKDYRNHILRTSCAGRELVSNYERADSTISGDSPVLEGRIFAIPEVKITRKEKDGKRTEFVFVKKDITGAQATAEFTKREHKANNCHSFVLKQERNFKAQSEQGNNRDQVTSFNTVKCASSEGKRTLPVRTLDHQFLPPDVDRNVFQILPAEIQDDLMKDWLSNNFNNHKNVECFPIGNGLNSGTSVSEGPSSLKLNSNNHENVECFEIGSHVKTRASLSEIGPTSSSKLCEPDGEGSVHDQRDCVRSNDTNQQSSYQAVQDKCDIQCAFQMSVPVNCGKGESVLKHFDLPDGIDAEVFSSLPGEVQDELRKQWKCEKQLPSLLHNHIKEPYKPKKTKSKRDTNQRITDFFKK